VAANLSVEMDVFDLSPFEQKGGRGKVHQVFGDKLAPLLDELNQILAA
jgi:type I restriction enzyme R subunit